jgi:hypothetical protein
MSGITHTQSQAVRSPRSVRLRTAAIVAAVVAAFALAAVLALANGQDAPTRAAAPPAAVESTVTQPGIRYDGGPEEGSWRASPANPGRPDGGPEEGTRGPGH